MLQANSTLDSETVKAALENTARSDAFTGTTPNTTWGSGKVDAFAAVTEVLNTTGISTDHSTITREFVLHQNYPNPFNPTTTILYTIPHASNVQVIIYDILGNAVKTLVNKNMAAGTHTVQWNGTNDAGEQVSSGVYLYRLTVNRTNDIPFVKTRKMIFLK